ncbi:hypothetical protein ABZ826_09455 [Streptomyces sp. NPDC047515]
MRRSWRIGLDAARSKLAALGRRAPADGRPQLVDLGMPVFTGWMISILI